MSAECYEAALEHLRLLALLVLGDAERAKEVAEEALRGVRDHELLRALWWDRMRGTAAEGWRKGPFALVHDGDVWVVVGPGPGEVYRSKSLREVLCWVEERRP